MADELGTPTQQNATVVSNWVKDGTPAAEPVTQVTPVITEPAKPAAPIVDATGRAHAPDSGQFTTKPSVEAAPVVTATAPSEAAPSLTEVQDFIEGRLNGQPFKLPKGVEIPVTRNGQESWLTAEEVRQDGLRLNDYKAKTMAAGERERQLTARQREMDIAAARVEARDKLLKEEEERYRASFATPDARQAYENHAWMLANDPHYRTRWEQSISNAEDRAELSVIRGEQEQAVVNQGVEMVKGWAAELAPQYPGVDSERVLALYGRDIALGTAKGHPAELKAVFDQESRVLSPVLSKVTALEKQIADLLAAQNHNAGTAAALARNGSPNGKPAGSPPAPTDPNAQPFKAVTMQNLRETNAAWARRG